MKEKYFFYFDCSQVYTYVIVIQQQQSTRIKADVYNKCCKIPFRFTQCLDFLRCD
jgi:hypothetical protein